MPRLVLPADREVLVLDGRGGLEVQFAAEPEVRPVSSREAGADVELDARRHVPHDQRAHGALADQAVLRRAALRAAQLVRLGLVAVEHLFFHADDHGLGVDEALDLQQLAALGGGATELVASVRVGQHDPFVAQRDLLGLVGVELRSIFDLDVLHTLHVVVRSDRDHIEPARREGARGVPLVKHVVREREHLVVRHDHADRVSVARGAGRCADYQLTVQALELRLAEHVEDMSAGDLFQRPRQQPTTDARGTDAIELR